MAVNPKVKIQAINLLSISYSAKTCNKGGIKIGIKAICTGIKFCEDTDANKISVNKTVLNQKISFLLHHFSFLKLFFC